MRHALQIVGSIFGRSLIATMLILLLLAMNATAAFAKTQSSVISSKQLSVTPMSPASDCYNSPSEATCDYIDPQGSGCYADAYTQAAANLYVGGVYWGTTELRYSPHCGTNWARFTSSGVQRYISVVDVRRCSVPAVGGGCLSGVVDAAGTYTYSRSITMGWSPMLYAYAKGARAGSCADKACGYTVFV